MFTVYCDDSGTAADNRVAVVAGYVSTEKEWTLFVDQWRRLLERHRLKMIHRADLESLRGECSEARGWNPERRRVLLRKAHQVIKRRTIVGIGSAVIKKDFEEAMPQWVKRLFGGVYGWCAHCCLVSVGRWSQQQPINTDISWVFEAGTTGAGQVATMFEALSEDRFGQEQLKVRADSLTFAAKSCVPLQAADTFAYEIYKHVENQILDSGKRPIRLSAWDLFRPQLEGKYCQYWDKIELARTKTEIVETEKRKFEGGPSYLDVRDQTAAALAIARVTDDANRFAEEKRQRLDELRATEKDQYRFIASLYDEWDSLKKTVDGAYLPDGLEVLAYEGPSGFRVDSWKRFSVEQGALIERLFEEPRAEFKAQRFATVEAVKEAVLRELRGCGR
jgi:hypothetical protein